MTQAMREGFMAKDFPQFMGYFESILGDNNYLCGENLTIADLSALPTITRFQVCLCIYFVVLHRFYPKSAHLSFEQDQHSSTHSVGRC